MELKMIELGFQGQTIRGAHLVPSGWNERRPLVVFFHGFTGNRVESHRWFVEAAKALAAANVSSLRCDFLGCGESDGDYSAMTLPSLVEQAEHILTWARQHHDGPVHPLGYSLGGLVASLLAEVDESVRKVALVSPGRPRRILERDAPLYTRADSDVIDVNGNRVGRAYYAGLSAFLSRPTAFHDGQDILIVHGSGDLATPIAFTDEYMRVPGGSKRLVVIEGADHGYNSLPWQAELLDTVVRFFSG